MTRPPRFQTQQINLAAAPQGIQPVRFDVFQSSLDFYNELANVGQGLANAAVQISAEQERTTKLAIDNSLYERETEDITALGELSTATKNLHPDEAAKQYSAFRDARAATVPEDIKQDYLLRLERRIAENLATQQKGFQANVQKTAQENLTNLIELKQKDLLDNYSVMDTDIKIQNARESFSELETLIGQQAEFGVSEAERQKIIGDFKDKFSISGLMQQMIESEDPDQFIETVIADNTLSSTLKTKAILKLRDVATDIHTTRKRANAKVREQKVNNAKETSLSLEFGIKTGKVDSVDEINKAQQEFEDSDGAKGVNVDQAIRLKRVLFKQKEDEIQASNNVALVNKARELQLGFDPKNTDDKKAVDDAYKALVSGKEIASDPDLKDDEVVNFIRDTGMIPQTLQSELRGIFRSGSIDQKIDKAGLIGKLRETVEGRAALLDMNKKDIARGVQLSELIKAGVSPERLEEFEKERAREPNLNEIRKAEFKDFKPRSTEEAITLYSRKNRPNISIRANSSVKGQVAQEFNSAYEEWFVQTGDEELALSMAQATLDKNWGTSRINPKENSFVKFPLHKFYSVTKDPEKEEETWMRKQLERDIKKIAPHVDPSTIVLSADGKTFDEAEQGSPKYTVMVNTNRGLEPIFFGDRFVRWNPDRDEQLRKLRGE